MRRAQLLNEVLSLARFYLSLTSYFVFLSDVNERVGKPPSRFDSSY